MNAQVNRTMFTNLFKHVVKETKSRIDITLPSSIKIQADVNICLFRRATYRCRTFSSKENFCDFIPRLYIVTQNKILATKIQRQLLVRLTVANHITVSQIIFSCHVLTQHACTGLAGGQIVSRERTVYEDVVEGDAFSLERIQHEVMCRPKVFFRVSIRA